MPGVNDGDNWAQVSSSCWMQVEDVTAEVKVKMGAAASKDAREEANRDDTSAGSLSVSGDAQPLYSMPNN